MRRRNATIVAAICGGLILLAALPSIADAPDNDSFAPGMSIGSLPFSDARNTVEATTQTGEPQPSCGQVAGTVWYRYRPDSDIRIVAETTRSGFDTVLAVWTGSSPGNLDEVACNDDTPEWLDSRVTLDAAANTTYHFQVGGLVDRFGELRFSVRAAESGAIAGHVAAGGSSAPGVCVDSYDAATDELMRSAETDTGGNYVIDELAPSDYLLQLSDCTTPVRYRTEWHRDAANREDSTVVHVNGGSTAVANEDLELLVPTEEEPTPPPTTQPPTAAPGRKDVSLSASRGRVRRGATVALTAVVSPCPGHEGDSIELTRNGQTIATATSDGGCAAEFGVRMRRKSVFQASSPRQDADHLGAVSNNVTVKVKKPKR